MAKPPDTRGLFHYLGNAVLLLFGLGAVGALVLGFFIDTDIPHALPGIYQYRVPLNGSVKSVVTEEMTVSAAGDSSLARAETTAYDRQGNRVGFRRDTVRSTGWEQPDPDPEAADTSRDIPAPVHDFGFRLILDDDRWGSQLRSHYAFDVNHTHRYEQLLYGGDGQLKRRYVHVNDPSGRYTSWTRYNRDGGFDGRDVTVYNEHGDYLEQKRYAASGSLDFHWTYTYNERGHLTEMASLDEDGIPKQKFVYVYEYDERGNWSQRTTLGFAAGGGVESTFVPRLVTRRRITYY